VGATLKLLGHLALASRFLPVDAQESVGGRFGELACCLIHELRDVLEAFTTPKVGTSAGLR
jgi:hypothetical protein